MPLESSHTHIASRQESLCTSLLERSLSTTTQGRLDYNCRGTASPMPQTELHQVPRCNSRGIHTLPHPPLQLEEHPPCPRPTATAEEPAHHIWRRSPHHTANIEEHHYQMQLERNHRSPATTLEEPRTPCHNSRGTLSLLPQLERSPMSEHKRSHRQQ